ncbi:MAG TPA: choice-of-anchor U domain-containing protein, partial [Pseudomonadales bacterium]|nr:choice-of-anchor U domain-containing protein [Pseudomonadales bacterium]
DGTGAVENGNDEEYGYPAGVFDFTVQDLPVPGQSVNVVIPITTGIPANAIYRKYEATTGWYTFVSDDDNYVSSAAGTSESCPAASSTVYEQGLTQGDFCVQLTIKDGGENDADGTANGIVDDPGGVAVDDNAPTLVPPADITVTATSGSGISSSDSSLASFFAGASATDSADDDVTITNDAPASLPVGTVTVTFTATDDSGNSATATAVVTVDSMKKGSESSWLGCSMGSGKGPVDPMLPMLLIATLVGIFRRKFAFLR